MINPREYYKSKQLNPFEFATKTLNKKSFEIHVKKKRTLLKSIDHFLNQEKEENRPTSMNS